MKKLLILIILSSALLTACGSDEEKKAEGPNFCDCIKVGEIPNECPEMLQELSPEEFAKKKAECE